MRVKWPWARKVVERQSFTLDDPAFAEWITAGTPNLSGHVVSERSVLGLSAVWRAVSLISGTIASVPMLTVRDADGVRVPIASTLDEPAGTHPDAMTPFAWKETVLLHLLLHGNAYLLHLRNAGGALIGLFPLHPMTCHVEWKRDKDGAATFEKLYTVSLLDGRSVTLQSDALTHVMGMSTDALRGMSPISIARNSLGTSIAADRAAAKQFGTGMTIAGMVTPDDDIDEAEAKKIKAGLRDKMTGPDNAGEIAVINRKLNFTPWTMNNADAQFLESRAFQIEEIARWFGVPPFELMQVEKQTSWGTGIESQQRGLARTVLSPWAQRLEQPLGRLLPRGQFVEFDFVGLERANPTDEIRLNIEQVNAGLITPNEARRRQNLEPIPGGDVLRDPKGTATPPTSEGVPA